MTENKLVLTAMFSVLWACDTVLTLKFTRTLGLEAEANPVMRLTLDEWGMYGFVAVKLFVLLLWLSVARKAATEIHVAICAIMSLVVIMGCRMVML